MTAPLFLVEWDPTTDTAHVRATFDTVTAEETVAGLDQFAACMRKLAEIDNLTGASGRIRVEVPEGVTVATVASTGPFPNESDPVTMATALVCPKCGNDRTPDREGLLSVTCSRCGTLTPPVPEDQGAPSD